MASTTTDARTQGDAAAHRSFLNTYYGISRHFYDVTRKYYLFGRDRVLKDLALEDWSSLVEIGPGTGRNLSMLREMRPDARLGGVEASDEMLKHARKKCPWATLEQGFAEDADLERLMGQKPDRILYSYCLSMVQKPVEALVNARKALAPGGEVVVVDFADLAGMPPLARRGLKKWLETFHVEPLDEGLLRQQDARISYGPGHYYLVGRMGPLPAD